MFVGRCRSVFFEVLKITLWAGSFALVSANMTLAGTLLVPNNYLTIQDAIKASNPGDTIVVASGVHRLDRENITISRKSLTLKSSFGAGKTVIQGSGHRPVITVAEESDAVIDGFTITSISDSDSPTLEGGGVYCSTLSSPTIKNNVITGNRAVFGGGIYCAHRSSPSIVNNIISNNKAVKFGGAIFSYRATPNITQNRITENEASSAGGGLFCGRDSPRLANNIIWKNKANFGGGVSCDRSSAGIINDTITANEAVYGGGLYFDGGAVRIMNTILWKNEDDLYSEMFDPATRPDHSDIGDGDFRGVRGNILGDPLFVDPENGDFRLQTGSPCIDAGNPDPIYNDPDGSRNDMGAFGGPEAAIPGR